LSGLVLGSWPGRESGHNRFLPILVDALEAEGVEVASFPDSRDIDLRGLDALLVHWPDKVFWEARSSREASWLIGRLLAKLGSRPARCRLVWMVHDLAPHDGRWFKRLAWPPYAGLLARLADGALTLSEGTKATVAAAYPALAGKPLGHIWHPSYPGEALAPEVAAAARGAFGWTGPERVFGYCGQLRAYKGVEELIRSFGALADPDARLLVAGRPMDAGYARTLTELGDGDRRIRILPEDLAPDRFRACLGACDIVVAPFRRYLHSGSIVHALSAGRPVLTPATPFATSLAAELGRSDWLQTYQGPLTPDILAAGEPPPTPLDLAPLAPQTAARRLRRFLENLRIPGRSGRHHDNVPGVSKVTRAEDSEPIREDR
jgi:glycosyltransferase involved in cell wall biosynthesis